MVQTITVTFQASCPLTFSKNGVRKQCSFKLNSSIYTHITVRKPPTSRIPFRTTWSSNMTDYPAQPDSSTTNFDQRRGLPLFVASSFDVPQVNVDQWLKDISDPEPKVRLRAIISCKDLDPSRAAPILQKVFDSGESELQNRGFAALFLGYKPNARSFEILSSIISNQDEPDEVRANAVAALGYLRDKRALPLCVSILRGDSHWSVASTAAVTLGMLAEANPDIRPLMFDDLVTTLRNTDPSDFAMVTACVGALGEVRDPRCVDDVLPFVDAKDFSVAQCACEALGQLPSKKSLSILQKIVDEKSAHVNILWAAEFSLKKIQDAMSSES